MCLKKMTLLEVEQGNLTTKVIHLMGSSWYWMPDVFEKFLKILIKTLDYYDLIELNPGFQ